MILCIDIGNTHTHFGLTGSSGCPSPASVPTALLDDPQEGLPAHVPTLLTAHPDVRGVALCSVVPAATPRCETWLERDFPALRRLVLTARSVLGLPLFYPRPEEIGPDRLANAVAARALFPGGSIVIDLGTAVTLEIVTASRGFEGGIIAPGVGVMRHYLHDQTALLPLLDESIEIERAIGQSTLEAMRIGTAIGFRGMINALLAAVLQELAARGEPPPTVITTGGCAALVRQSLSHPHHILPDLTLRGLAQAWHLNFSPCP